MRPLHLYCVEWYCREFGRQNGMIVSHAVATSQREAWAIVQTEQSGTFDGLHLIHGRIQRIETVGDHEIMLRRKTA